MNRNYNRRDNIIFGEDYDNENYLGGVRYYEQLPYQTLERLVNEDFAELDECQNCSPTIQEFLKETAIYKDNVMFDGYVVTPDRDDYRVSVDTVSITIPFEEPDVLAYFTDLYHHADEFSLSPDNLTKLYTLRAWWD